MLILPTVYNPIRKVSIKVINIYENSANRFTQMNTPLLVRFGISLPERRSVLARSNLQIR